MPLISHRVSNLMHVMGSRNPPTFADGLFSLAFLQVECSAILVVGMICEFIVGTFRIYPLGTLTIAHKAKRAMLPSDACQSKVPNTLSDSLCCSHARRLPLVPRKHDRSPYRQLDWPWYGLVGLVRLNYFFAPKKSVKFHHLFIIFTPDFLILTLIFSSFLFFTIFDFLLNRGVSNLLTGWFCGHFGIFVSKEIPPHPALNYVGLVCAILSVFLYLPVKSETKQDDSASGSGSNAKRSAINSDLGISSSSPSSSASEDGYNRLEVTSGSDFDRGAHHNEVSMGSAPKSAPLVPKEKLFGFGLSIVAGVLYGSNMIPVKFLQDKYPAANPLEFALSHYIGIWLTSTAFMVGYAFYKRNNPFVNPKSLLAAMLAGTAWGVAQGGGFIANANLGLTTSFPIICTGPGVIGSLWGIFAFKEIRGARNYLWLGAAFTLTFAGIILITLSKVPKL